VRRIKVQSRRVGIDWCAVHGALAKVFHEQNGTPDTSISGVPLIRGFVPEQFKFLAIKNWHRYQPDNRLRNKDARLVWVRDYTDRDDDYEFQSLTMFQRAVFQGILRIAGKTPSRLVRNDAVHLASTMHTVSVERHCIPQAIAKLIASGLVIPTNDENFYDSITSKCGGEGEGECAQTAGAQRRRGSAVDTASLLSPPRDSAGEEVPVEQEKPNPLTFGFNIPDEVDPA
jgi:hypothetical protein